MSFDEQPDNDPHGECAAEIARLQSRLEISPEHSYDGIDCRDTTIKMLEAEVVRLNNKADHLTQQAQIQAQEARTQRATVISILQALGLPENDWEACGLVTGHVATLRAKVIEECAQAAQNTPNQSGTNDDDQNWFAHATKSDCAKAIRALAAPCDQQKG